MANALNVKIGGDLRELEKALDSAVSKTQSAGKRMSSIGKSLTQAVTLPLLAISGASLKMASDFEASMTKIETLVGLSRDQVQAMESDVISLSRTTGVSAQSLSEALFTVTSAGARGAEAMDILAAASKASASGLGETQSIARAVTASIQAYGSENLSAAKATDVFTAIVREGNLEAERLAPVLGRVIGIASQAGVSFEEVGASIATYTRLGVSAEESTTALRAILSAIVRPTSQSKEALAQLGMTAQDLQGMVNEQGLAGTLRFLLTEFDGNTEALAQLIPSVEGLSAVLGTAGAQGEQYSQIVDNISNSQGILNEAFDKTTQTAKFQFNQAINDLRTDSLELGNALLPLATNVLSKVRDVMGRVTAILKQMRPEVIGIGIAAAAAGPLLWGLGAAITGIGTAIAILTSPVTLVVGAIAGLVTAIIYLRDNWQAVIERVSDIGWWRNAMIDMVQFFLEWNAISLIIDGFNSLLSFFGQATIPNPFTGISDTLEGLKVETKEFEHEFGSLKDAFINTFTEFTGINLVGMFTPVTQEVERVRASIDSVGRTAREISTDFITLETVAVPAVKRIGTETSNAITFAKQIANDFTNSFGAGMANVVVQGKNLVDTLKNIGKLLASAVIQKGLSALLTGGLGGTGFFGAAGGLFGKIFGVNDALITSSGDVVQFHPDDNILAMKDFSGIGGGSQRVEVFGTLKGQDLFISSDRGSKTYGR